ncbi:hypothetical protein LTR32_006475 [Rachicladosporium monterosium]|uniref:Uncharacterized protein n=1 Tax=Rachicladosporium monterosium TaxID=1507873 RepID=A0ABR0KZY7_9PEZI|nr:hypothetical protein LTR32_006475 [Rachicladosporium monterosium]
MVLACLVDSLLEGCTSYQKYTTGDSEPTLNHVEVSMKQCHTNAVHPFHAFHVDSLLGRLLENGSVRSKLLLAHLHALKSSCIVDPLTHKTGTESALSILNSAALQSSESLEKDDIDILVRTGNELMPKRSFYPQHTVKWSDRLSFMSTISVRFVRFAAKWSEDDCGNLFQRRSDSEVD